MPKKKNGSVYILVLALALVLVALVLGLSYQLLQFRHGSRSDTSADQARIHAELGIRHALHFTQQFPNWRNVLSNGKWLNNITVDQATYSVTGIDPVDGILQNNDNDPVLLTGTATVNGVSRTVEVTARQQVSELLSYALAAGNNIFISVKVVINGDVTSNANISKTGNSTRIFGNAEAVGTIVETTNITGTITPFSDPKTFPDSLSIIQFYTTNGTDIPVQSTYEKMILSSLTNPFGPTPDPEGLYVINCNGQNITIKDCRIVGTLVILNPGSSSIIDGDINWQPARPDYPALIVEGDFSIAVDSALSENSLKVDLSLPTEPGYGTTQDSYPNLIKGLIYVDGKLTIGDKSEITGSVITTGELIVESDGTVTTDAALLDNPPVGFCESQLIPISGTWQQIIP